MLHRRSFKGKKRFQSSLQGSPPISSTTQLASPKIIPALESKNNLLHISIGVTPSIQAGSVHELRMIKAALLYGDNVKLYSLGATMLLSLIQTANLEPHAQIEFLEQVLPLVSNNPEELKSFHDFRDSYIAIRNKKKPTLEDQFRIQITESAINTLWQQVRPKFDEMATKGGGKELIAALNSGRLEVHAFQDESSLDGMAKEYMDSLGNAVTSGSTYPLFDEQSGDLIKAAINEGLFKVSDSSIARGKHGALVGNLFERLPLFDLATVDEILDIREELRKPLVRFRSAVVKFSEQIKIAAWDNDFEHEVQTIFIKEVAPGILEIEESVKSNKFLSSLVPSLTSKGITATSILGIGLDQMHVISHATAAGIGLAAGGVTTVYDVYKEWRQKQKTVETNQLFFYYRVGKLLQ